MWVYWTVLFLFTSLGLFIPYILIEKLIIEDLRLAHNRKKARQKSRKKRRVQKKPVQKKPVQKKTIKDIASIASGVFMVIVLFAISALILWGVFPNWKDLPRAATGLYKVTQGQLNSSKKIEMTGKSWGYAYQLTVDGVRYSSSLSGRHLVGDTVEIEFLPNTRIIVSIKSDR